MFIYYSEDRNRRLVLPKVSSGGTHHIELIAMQDISIDGIKRLYTGIWIYPDTLHSVCLMLSDANDPKFFVRATNITIEDEVSLVIEPLVDSVQICTGDIVALGTYFALGINENLTVMRQPKGNLDTMRIIKNNT